MYILLFSLAIYFFAVTSSSSADLDIFSPDIKSVNEDGQSSGLNAFDNTFGFDPEAPLFDDAPGLDLQASLFDDTSGLDLQASLFDSLDTLNLNGNLSPDLLVATDNSEGCISMLSPSSTMLRGRADLCDTPAASSDSDAIPKLWTEEEVQDYWCSKKSMGGIASLPVCDMAPRFRSPSELAIGSGIIGPFPPSGFQNLLLCMPSKFMLHSVLVMQRRDSKGYWVYEKLLINLECW